MIKLKTKNDTPPLLYGSEGSSGVDVRALEIKKIYKGSVEVHPDRLKRVKSNFLKHKKVKLRAFERVLFGTGVSIKECPADAEIQVRSRSGLALKQGLTVANQPGTIDSDYKGEICIILLNNNNYLVDVEYAQRIAQLVATPVLKFDGIKAFEKDRDDGGFGSTGK